MDNHEELMKKLEEIKKRQDELEKIAKEREQQQKSEEESHNQSDDSNAQNYSSTSNDFTAPTPEMEKKENNYDDNNDDVEKENDSNKRNKWIIIGVAAGIAAIIIIVGFLKIYNNKNKKNKDTNSFTQTETTTSYSSNSVSTESTSNNLESINGYSYKKDDSITSSYDANATTSWLDKLYVNNTDFHKNSEIQNAYADYCRLVSEIEKVDQGIMPGTNKRFEEVTYVEVDAAYKDHLREISQIRQIFELVNGNDKDLEIAAGCNYKETQWNINNTQYKIQQFKSSEIAKRWDSYSKSNNSGNNDLAGNNNAAKNNNTAENQSNSRRSIDDLDIEELEYVMEEVVQNKNERILANYSKQELKIFRNMVMAINHYKFQSGELKDYFERKPWYDGYIEDQSQIRLNDYQRRFVEAVKKYE